MWVEAGSWFVENGLLNLGVTKEASWVAACLTMERKVEEKSAAVSTHVWSFLSCIQPSVIVVFKHRLSFLEIHARASRLLASIASCETCAKASREGFL